MAFVHAEWLDASQNAGYGVAPLPCPQDERISEDLRSWKTLKQSQRDAAAARLTDNQRLTLCAYAERMASLAVRQADADSLTLGLIGWGLGISRQDQRECLPLVSLFHDAALRIGASPSDIFESASFVLDGEAKSVLNAFLSRSGMDKGIEAMGYQIRLAGDGFRYVRGW